MQIIFHLIICLPKLTSYTNNKNEKEKFYRNIFSGLSINIGRVQHIPDKLLFKKNKEFHKLDTVLDKLLTKLFCYIPIVSKLLKHCALIAFKNI